MLTPSRLDVDVGELVPFATVSTQRAKAADLRWTRKGKQAAPPLPSVRAQPRSAPLGSSRRWQAPARTLRLSNHTTRAWARTIVGPARSSWTNERARADGLVTTRRQQTFAKMAREREVKERRARKLEKKHAAAAERKAKAAEGTIPAGDA